MSLRPTTLYLGVTFALALAAAGLSGASGLLRVASSPENEARALEAQIRADYQDRLAALREQMDMSADAAARQRRTLETQMQALERRQADLDRQAQEIKRLARLAGPPAETERSRSRSAASPAPAPAAVVPSRGKPHPDGMTLRSDSDHAGLFHEPEASLTPRLALLDADARALERKQALAIRALAERAHRSAQRVRAALALAGLSFDRLNRTARIASGGEGGPFVPVKLDGDDPPRATLAKLETEIATDSKLATILPYLPLRHPLRGALTMTSPFGLRVDPFLGRMAEHPGEDLRASIGDPVMATGAGKVLRAAYDGGYGNMVEIDHGDGIVTRYGHLSAILVRPGQQVAAGQIIGRVGTTGRSTGPHLHYEVRIDGHPVNPSRFLRAGEALSASSLSASPS